MKRAVLIVALALAAIEFFFMLRIDWEGRVTTELLGEKWLNRGTGEASYLRGTEEIAQRDYDGADFFRYGGDDCCECAWEWVELSEGWSEADQRQALTDSWEHFAFDTLGILAEKETRAEIKIQEEAR